MENFVNLRTEFYVNAIPTQINYSSNTVKHNNMITNFSLIVPLANHFSGEEMIEEDAQFLVGTFEEGDSESISEEFQQFTLEAAHLNFERLTGMSYGEYQRRKDRRKDRGYNFAPPGMMGFITRNTYDLDEDTWCNYKKNSNFILKGLLKKKLSKEGIEIILEIAKQSNRHPNLIKKECNLRISSDIEYYNEEQWYGIKFSERNKDDDYSAKILYILFLCIAEKTRRSKIGKKEGFIPLDMHKISEKHKTLLGDIDKKLQNFGTVYTRGIIDNCQKYIDTINNSLLTIFDEEVAEKYCISKIEAANGNALYGIYLNVGLIDLGEFRNLI